MENHLMMVGISKIIFVLDGSTDGSYEYLSEIALSDNRIEIVRIKQSGVQAARNAGIQASSTSWLLFIDDDDFAPSDYAEVLLAEAFTADAALVGAPWLNATELTLEGALALARQAPVSVVSLLTPVSVFTRTGVESPFFHSACLVRSDIAKKFLFDRDYRGNSWREETDFFLRITTAGHKAWRSADTYTWSAGRFPGGHSRSHLQYEYWVAVNEAAFLRRHSGILSLSEPDWDGWLKAWGMFLFKRHSRYIKIKWRAAWKILRNYV